MGSYPDSIQSDTTSHCISLTYILLLSSNLLVVLNTLNKSRTQNCSFLNIAVHGSHLNLKKGRLFYIVGSFILNRQENIAGQVCVTHYVWQHYSAWDWWQILSCNVVTYWGGLLTIYVCMYVWVYVYIYIYVCTAGTESCLCSLCLLILSERSTV
jgi:hypothetical protein